eukprot:CAMPEP_0119372188 /NCGR_PEP_ID=MMETSP1334-20130426/18210_1 /TAXON_ID=127549 /ORGANISM="Calcidiscus leptoporus, Strain RCC1130" /LENGTH=323 /DNA_ID=CAMNT_0007389611 /DNA_START=87 /DNA_END=1058 /DNA_ORIENTATION=+
MYLNAVTTGNIVGNNYAHVLPAMQNAAQISAASFAHHEHNIDVSANSANQFTIINAPGLLKPLQELELSRSVVAACQTIDHLLEMVLPHVHVPGRTRLGLNDVLPFGFALARGAYFPDLHWDTDWSIFPEADGFNLWYMVELPQKAAKGEGSMFLAPSETTSHVSDPQPVQVQLHPDGSTSKLLHLMGAVNPKLPLHHFANIEDMKIRWQYLNMSRGEVLLMGKRVMHMSDPRPHLPAHKPKIRVGKLRRLAMNVRVLIRPTPYAPVPVWLGHPYTRMLAGDKSFREPQSFEVMNVTHRHALLFGYKTAVAAHLARDAKKSRG